MKNKIMALIIVSLFIFTLNNVLATNTNQYSIRGEYLYKNIEGLNNFKISLNINGNKDSGQGYIIFSMNGENYEMKGNIKLIQTSNNGKGNLTYRYLATYHYKNKYFTNGKWIKSEALDELINLKLEEGNLIITENRMKIPIIRLR